MIDEVGLQLYDAALWVGEATEENSVGNAVLALFGNSLDSTRSSLHAMPPTQLGDAEQTQGRKEPTSLASIHNARGLRALKLEEQWFTNHGGRNGLAWPDFCVAAMWYHAKGNRL